LKQNPLAFQNGEGFYKGKDHDTHKSNTFWENIKQTIASHWWMPLVRGILLVIFGVIMLA